MDPLPLPSEPVSILHLSRTDGIAPGGVDSSVGQLVEALQQRKVAAQWYSSCGQLPVLGDRRLAAQLRALQPDLLHVHGLWQFPTRVARLLEQELPVLIAPHGMLDAWALARHRWKKTPVWHLWEQQTLERARCLHALSHSEARSIRALGFRGPIAILPNGTPSIDRSLPRLPPPWSERVPRGERVLLFLGRLHAKKAWPRCWRPGVALGRKRAGKVGGWRLWDRKSRPTGSGVMDRRISIVVSPSGRVSRPIRRPAWRRLRRLCCRR